VVKEDYKGVKVIFLDKVIIYDNYIGKGISKT